MPEAPEGQEPPARRGQLVCARRRAGLGGGEVTASPRLPARDPLDRNPVGTDMSVSALANSDLTCQQVFCDYLSKSCPHSGGRTTNRVNGRALYLADATRAGSDALRRAPAGRAPRSPARTRPHRRSRCRRATSRFENQATPFRLALPEASPQRPPLPRRSNVVQPAGRRGPGVDPRTGCRARSAQSHLLALSCPRGLYPTARSRWWRDS